MTLRDSYLAGDDGVREEDRLPGEGNLPGESEALARDANDPLSRYRDLFLLPDGPAGRHGPPAIYFAGQLHIQWPAVLCTLYGFYLFTEFGNEPASVGLRRLADLVAAGQL